MSFFSRLFRKASSRPPRPASAPAPAPSAKPGPASSKPAAADRGLAAAAEEQALQAIIDAGDVQALARLVVAGKSTKVRQAAAHAIEDPEVLRQLLRDVRGGNDKGVYKILKSKRDRMLEEARKLEQLRADIEAISSDLERHSQRAYDSAYEPTLDQLERRWNAVAAQADADLRSRVQQWIERSRETLAEHRRQVATAASQERAAAHAAAEAERLHQEQMQAAAAAAADQERLRKEQQLALAAQQEAEQQTERQAAREIGELIRKLRSALSDGSTSRAAAMRRAIDEKVAGGTPLPTHLAGQLQQLDRQLADFKDWKSFSVAPKRAELIEDMESLVGAALDPPTLADRIKSLRDQWRALGKGAVENVEADWQRFDDAAKKAYEPCVEYFAAQARVRNENLRRRDALLARLTAFEAAQDWAQPDWRTVIKTLRETKEEWRGVSPVDRVAGKPQQDAFSAITASLQGRLDAEYARNVQQKESLIERARALLAGDDHRKSIDAVKALQQQWRTVGPVPREADQRLWGEFRQHCDGVFQKREQEFAAYTGGLEHNKAQALSLCEQVERIAALEGAECVEHKGALAGFRRAFEALGEFPRADTRELRNRFDRALDRCEAAFARQDARDAERAWSDLFDATNPVRAYRLAVAGGLDPQQLDSLKEAAETCIASVQRWPKGGLQGLKQALLQGRSEDLAANQAALRRLCIRAEILTDTPTPAEDQALRREHQLQRLVQNMGQGPRADESDLDTLAIEWVGVGPVEDAVYAPLLQRFRRCRERDTSRVS